MFNLFKKKDEKIDYKAELDKHKAYINSLLDTLVGLQASGKYNLAVLGAVLVHSGGSITIPNDIVEYCSNIVVDVEVKQDDKGNLIINGIERLPREDELE